MTLTFSPDRLEVARQRRGRTKGALAEAVGITPRSLHNYVTNRRVPKPDVVGRFASVLDFPVEFFYGSAIDFPPEGGTSYRALSRATSRHRMQAEAIGTLGMLLADWIDSVFELPAVDIPTYDIYDPELAAEAVRASWELGELSISNVVELLEAHGAYVFALATDTPALDAFSFWLDDSSFVFLNTSKAPERTRMDAAHELGHLVLHTNGGAARSRQAEHEANRFAAALLMPASSVIAKAPLDHTVTLNTLIESKKNWNVSVTSLIVRMKHLDILTDHRYRTLFAEASQRGFRLTEPQSCPPDTSAVLDAIFNPYKEGSVDVRMVANQIAVYPDEIYKLLWGLVRFPLPVPN